MIRFWSLKTGKQLGEEKTETLSYWLSISPDGRLLRCIEIEDKLLS